MAQVKPKKALGQHFLTDLGVAAKIAATLNDYVGVPVLEIGPGMGVLTRPLLEAGHDLTVVEIDRESVEYLDRTFPELRGHVIEGDFLQMDLQTVFDGLKELSREIELKGIKNVQMKELSMGMTNDYPLAVKCGSTMVRVGTGIFGKRDYTKA